MEKVSESKNATDKMLDDHAPVMHGTSSSRKDKASEIVAVGKTWKGKSSFQEAKEPLSDILSSKSSDSYEEMGCSSFSGASHPPEPVDVDLMRTVYVTIDEKKSETGCLVKGLSVKGPFIEDLSIRVPGMRPSSPLSPIESLVEESRGSGTQSSPFSTDRASQCMENSYLPQESDEKECVWDASLPPSGNVSPHSSIDSTGVVTAMSIVNSCTSTYRSEGITSDGMLSVERNFESTKASVRGESLESAKTSMSRASDSSGLSDDSNWSNITGSANKPHKGNDPRWKAILAVRSRDGLLGMSHFRLLRRLGCGDIGSVYLSELSGTRCYFAMKVMDKASLASRKKLTRAQTEREILQLLDHPFLPTLYTHFETDRFSCLVMEFCPGGDLHTLRQRQPGKHFSEYASRFYAAEVLLSIEYLHMLGVVYRDLNSSGEIRSMATKLAAPTSVMSSLPHFTGLKSHPPPPAAFSRTILPAAPARLGRGKGALGARCDFIGSPTNLIMVASTSLMLFAGRFGLAPSANRKATAGLKLEARDSGLQTGDPAGFTLADTLACGSVGHIIGVGVVLGLKSLGSL